MKNNVYIFFKKMLLQLLSGKAVVELEYFLFRKKLLNLNNPKSFSDKIQWIKLYGGIDQYAKYVDKYEVRKYIEKTIGKDYLIPLIGVWDTFDAIPFNELPDKFVLKGTHGSGFNFICHDKSTLDKKLVRDIVSKWLKENYYTRSAETQYKYCKPRILCEKYMEDDSGSLRDYKFFCFNGIPQIIQVDSDRFKGHKRDLFDTDWNKLPYTLEHPNTKELIKKPGKFNEMIEVTKKLSKQFPFVRVDLYLIGDKVYFGELTFTPGNGLEHFKPINLDYQLGDLIDLSKYIVNQQ